MARQSGALSFSVAQETTFTLRKAATSGGIANWNMSTRIVPPVPLDSEHPLYILYTSGSTGKPKGILHTTGGYLVGVYSTTKYVFDIRDEDIYWCTADVGWVTGHSYVVYGPLANGATTVMYEGAPNWPEPDRFWRIIEEYRRQHSLYRADGDPRVYSLGRPMGRRNTIFHRSACSARSANRSIPKHGCGITKISAAAVVRSSIRGGKRKPGAIMITPLPGAIPTKPGSATLPFFGVDAAVVDEKGQAKSDRT